MGKILTFLKKRWWLPLILVVVALVIWQASGKEAQTYVTEPVTRGTLTQTVEVTGQVESAEEIDLNFKTSGLIQDMLVKTGDQVVAGQKLASLRAGEMSAQVADAQAAVDIAQSQLAELLAGASQEDVQVTEQELRAAELNYAAAVDNLASIESNKIRELTDVLTAGYNTITDKYFIAKYSLEILDDALLDSEADSNLITTDYQGLVFTEEAYNIAQVHYDNLAGPIASLTAASEQGEILSNLDEVESLLQEINVSFNQGFQVLQNALASGTYTQAVIDSWKTTFNTQSAAVNSAISAVHTAASNIRTKDLSYQNQITDANNKIQSALTSLNLAQAKLNYKTAAPRNFEIESAQASVRRAQANLNRYFSLLGDTIIRAPIAGVITEVNFSRGEITSLATPVISMNGLTNLQIEANVPESDISKITLNDQVEITLDALSNSQPLMGTVTFIDPAATIINDVTYYKIKINFNEPSEQIKAGMTADLTVATDQLDEVLIIPARAVTAKDGQKFVQILTVDNQAVELEVVTGIRGDNGEIQILEGLTEGQQVITLIRNGQ